MEDKYKNQISDRGVKWLINHVNDVKTEILQFVEPGTSISLESTFLIPRVLAEFHDPKIGIVCGEGGGHAFIRVKYLKEVLKDHSFDTISNYDLLVKAFREKGFKIKKVRYIMFEQLSTQETIPELTKVMTVSFRGAKIPQFEADILQALETQSRKQFNLVDEVEGDTKMDFSVESSRIAEIGLSNCGVSTLPESIGNLKSLKKLYVDQNQLKTLPESIGNLTSLTCLRVFWNKLSTLPESIGHLSSLKELNLTKNQLSALPESITKLKSLKVLGLAENKFTTLPESITQLKSLTYLNLNGNKLSTLPESIVQLSSLKELYLEGNQLSTLPKSIGKLKSLESLMLPYNQLKTLPKSIGNLKLLRLYINYNPLDSRAKSILKQLKKKGVYVYT